ncbi:MAG: hypothetical protein J6V09_03730 [Clostridia bacterium]|nr:hypothetical protein [Clostridia bacterium]
MIEQDTVRLLRECDAGAKMGVSSIDDVIGRVKSGEFREILEDCKAEHKRLGEKITERLHEYEDEGKDPPAIASAMSHIKTSMKLAMCSSDATVADLMTEGCNMGVKSLNQYLNKYEAADEHSKRLAKELIGIERQLAVDIATYL